MNAQQDFPARFQLTECHKTSASKRITIAYTIVIPIHTPQKIIINSKTLLLSNQYLLLRADQCYELINQVRGSEYVTIIFKDNLLDALFTIVGDKSREAFLQGWFYLKENELGQFLQTLVFRKLKFPSAQLTTEDLSRLRETIMEVQRTIRGELFKVPANHWQVKKELYNKLVVARSTIETTQEHVLGIAEVASSVGLSPHYFARLFKSTFGTTPYQYFTIATLRIRMKDLIACDVSFSEIAICLGYSEHSAFTRAFKKIFGVTPEIYRSSIVKTSC
jgi:AraC-like DNA-binding protein